MISILLCVTISFSAAASVTGDFELPRVTVNSWAEFKQALDNNPTGVEVVLGRTIIAGSGDSQLDIPVGCNVVLDLNGKTMNRNTLETGNYNRAFAVNGSLIIRDSAGGGRITGGHAWGGGCITVRYGGTFVLESGTLTQNEANGYGGAVYNKGTFTMQGGTITGNQAWGTETDANDGSGAIVNWRTFVMTGGTISNNIAYANGGGILNGGTALISGGSITGNQAREYNGGGIASIRYKSEDDPPELTITGGSITGNTCDLNGGGIVTDGELNIRNCVISDNTAQKYAGGISAYADQDHADDHSRTLIGSGTVIENNIAGYNGGGINLLTNTTIEDGVVIRGNISDCVGGGINVYECECHWGNITVTGNKASTYGSGAYISSTARIWLDRGGIVIADNEDDDAFLYKTAFHLSAPLTSARIGVDTASLGDAMTYGYSTHNGETNPNTLFSVRTREPEGEGLYVGLLNGEAARLSPVYYAVTARITGDGSGQVTLPETIYEGQSVTMPWTADEGYGLSSVAATGVESGATIEVADNGDGTITFTAPAEDVLLTCYFDRLYAIAVSEELTDTVIPDRAQACTNQRVKLAVKGDLPGLLTYTDPNGRTVTIAAGDDGAYSFPMPRSDTTISAAYSVAFESRENVRVGCASGQQDNSYISPIYAVPGETVTVSVPPADPSCTVLVRWIYALNGEEHRDTVTAAVPYRVTFTMPAANVTVSVSATQATVSTWAGLQAALSAGQDVALTADIAAGADDSALTVPSGVTAVVYMNGCSIDRGLTDAEDAGSVIVNNGSLTLLGPGTVTGGSTTGHGGGILNTGSLAISGAVRISDNAGADGVDNVYLMDGAVIRVSGSIAGASLGIGMQTPGVFTEGLGGQGSISAFTSDSADCGIALTEGEAMLSPLYIVSVPDSHVTADRISAGAGETVALTVEADDGVELDAVLVKAADGTAVALGEDLTFVMPACDVTVTARWQAPAYGTPDFTLPGQITHVESMAFSGAAMRVVWIPDGCIQIGALAFSDCPNLTQVRIPDRCAIGTGAFEGSAGIVYIYGTAGSDAERYCLENSGCVFVEE